MTKSIIVAIDEYEQIKFEKVLDQLDPNLCMVKIGSVSFNSLGRETHHTTNQILFHIYDYGSVEKKFIVE